MPGLCGALFLFESHRRLLGFMGFTRFNNSQILYTMKPSICYAPARRDFNSFVTIRIADTSLFQSQDAKVLIAKVLSGSAFDDSQPTSNMSKSHDS